MEEVKTVATGRREFERREHSIFIALRVFSINQEFDEGINLNWILAEYSFLRVKSAVETQRNGSKTSIENENDLMEENILVVLKKHKLEPQQY